MRKFVQTEAGIGGRGVARWENFVLINVQIEAFILVAGNNALLHMTLKP